MINKSPAYIALTSVILIGGILVALVLAITYISLNQKLSLIGQDKSIKAYYLANACGHYAVLQIQDNQNYTGDETIEIEGNSCYIEAVSGSGETRTIFASSQVGQYQKRIKIEISQISPETKIDYWGLVID